MTQVGSEKVRTSRWTPRQRSRGTTGGTSGSTSMSLKLSDRLRNSWYESGTVKGGFRLSSRAHQIFCFETHNSKDKKQLKFI